MNYLQTLSIGKSYRRNLPCLFICFLCICPSLLAKIVYVKPNGIGSGISWNKAAGDLAAVLKKAEAGTEIWVAAGIYKPTKNNNRSESFIIPDGVKVYGGFQGDELFLTDRNPILNLTVLSGEIGENGKEDNSFNVVYTRNVSNKTVVDGFHIMGGYARNWQAAQGHRSRSGAGWYNDGSFGQSNPIIINCFFSNNWAVDGGGIYNNGMAGKCEIVVKNCSFINNIANADGGAVFNSCHEKGIVYADFHYCTFEANESNNGAGIFNYNISGIDHVLVDHCNFIKNKAMARGSAIFDHSFDSVLIDCQSCKFEENKAELSNKDIYCSLFKDRDSKKDKHTRTYRM